MPDEPVDPRLRSASSRCFDVHRREHTTGSEVSGHRDRAHGVWYAQPAVEDAVVRETVDERLCSECGSANSLRERAGWVGPDTAAALLVTVGDNLDRLRSERAFAHLCGVAPIPASSGKTNRHRLHRGGDSSANRALHIAVIVRMRYCTKTRNYVARRTAEGLSKPEVIRCLKRYLAREIYRTVRADYTALTAPT